MSTRSRITPHSVLTNGNMTTTLNSTPTIIQDISQITYTISWSGASPVGQINCQISNDYRAATNGQAPVAGTWTSLPLSSPTTISGNTGTGVVDIDQLGAYAVRIQYVPVSGTGTLNVLIAGKCS